MSQDVEDSWRAASPIGFGGFVLIRLTPQRGRRKRGL